MANEDFKNEYNEQNAELELVDEFIEARKASGMTQKENL